MAEHNCDMTFCRCHTTDKEIRRDFRRVTSRQFSASDFRRIYKIIHGTAEGGENGAPSGGGG